ncbi:MAG TPA: type II toxin-antitoxin system PemK/MazF family toxin [Candidatus Agrococcus pullicola]|uniref:Type II toxin-antitoxin system PemK/MazF family toxin n=1 Tax=Candidatus Agrococcus pullicola TaxID=2838429 RepID=A0A9D1YU45_9MICO|nr:type II toxin-antitoxin system PemK/MazF family toxin [Candidatus Agrococcus pullicola]
MVGRRVELSPGDVWWAAPDATVGRERSGRRPVVVVAGQQYLDAVTELVIVVPVTSTNRGWANHVKLSGSDSLGASFAMTEQIRTVSRRRLRSRIGSVTPTCLERIRTWVSDFTSD